MEPRRTSTGTDGRQTQVLPDGRQTQMVALDDEAIVDLKQTANFLGYIARSARRHRRLVLTCAAVTFALVATLAVVMPRSFRIETRILTQKSLVMSALVHPDRAIPQSADAPTSGAVELIKSRQNLENLLGDTDLEKIWQEKRSPLAKFKDKTLQKVFGTPDPKDVHEAYLKMLDEKVEARVEGEVILLNVEWPNAEVAMVLAKGLVARFLTLRHDAELSQILEPVSILSRNVENSRMGIEVLVKRMQKILDERENDLQGKNESSRSESRRKVRKSRFISIRKPATPNKIEGENDALRKQLAQKQSALSLVRQAHADRLRRAEDELANLRASLGPDHPDVIEAKHKLEAIAKEPTEVGELEADQARLATQVGALPQPAPVRLQPDKPTESEEQKFDMMRVPVSDDLYKEMDKDPEVMAVLDELKKRQDGHDELMRRLSAARMESETANVAFDHRYILTEPPVFPQKAVKPNVPLMLGGGAVGALLLGFFLALLADVSSGKILEAWQIERFLQVKLLGEIEQP